MPTPGIKSQSLLCGRFYLSSGIPLFVVDLKNCSDTLARGPSFGFSIVVVVLFVGATAGGLSIAVGASGTPHCNEDGAWEQTGLTFDEQVVVHSRYTSCSQSTTEAPGDGTFENRSARTCVLGTSFSGPPTVGAIVAIDLCVTASAAMSEGDSSNCTLEPGDWCGYAETDASTEVNCGLVECVAQLVFAATHADLAPPGTQFTCTTPPNGDCGLQWNHFHAHNALTTQCHTASGQTDSAPITMTAYAEGTACYVP